ncbi:hypothetical protein ACSBQY_01060 [Micrococcus lylae]|uniref:hypothetical protein n=1 Tax=Micrococcus lylae TaxID=1273 RepID=UPI0021A79FC5|nr:hypothetical protein [Micrococcus lylae]MCT2006780.1 hypothetical protein [Micrococcus lylae]MCT2070686.1 hypothetical protein [Micrococcus lylae]
MTTERKPISRRAVTAGLAWSVPAVTAVATAPLAAASPLCPVVEVTGDVVKYPGNNHVVGTKHRYGFPVHVHNKTDVPVVVTRARPTSSSTRRAA